MNPAPKNQRRFVCLACRMSVQFPPEHPMEQKPQGSYHVQDKWFCSQKCFNAVYFPQESASSERR